MKAHIGKLIKNLAWDQHMTSTQLGRAVGISPQAVCEMYKRAIIHPKWIPVLSKALDHDLWQYYADPNGESVAGTELEERIAELEAENDDLRKELAYLKEINELLRKTGG